MDRKRLIEQMDRRVVWLGGVASLLYIVLVSLITFLPRTPQLMACLVAGWLPLVVLLGPMVILGTVGLRKNREDAIAYGVANTLVMAAYGTICGLLLYFMIPRAE